MRGPWPSVESDRADATSERAGDGASRKMVLGFIVRECAVALGHQPSPRELADWANHQYDERGEFCLFGRAVSEDEAKVILAHPGREVTVRAPRVPVAPGEDLFGSR